MAALLILKEKFKEIYADYHRVIVPLAKAVVAFLMLTVINDKIGYMARLDSIVIVLALTAFCAIMPRTVTIIVGFAVTMLHLATLSLEVTLVAAAVFVVMVLLYVRFCSRDILLLALVPISFCLGIPYIMPLAAGVLCGPAAALTLGCGVVIHYYIDYIAANAVAIQAINESALIEKIRMAADGLIKNDAMFLAVFSFAIATLVVHIIRKQSIDHAWSVAIFSGAMTNVILNFMGILVFDNGPSIISLLLGTVIAVPLAILIGFIFMGLDYSRTEKVQFEDEDYYYYVKAVPKMKLQAPSKTVKRINTQRYRTHHR